MTAAKPSLDPSAFERAVREHHQAVFRTALRIVRDEALALDAAQETFLRVLEGKLDLARAADPERLLRCAAAREALMVLRAARSRRRREELHAMKHEEGYEDLQGEKAESASLVRRALLELPEKLRTALVLRFQEGLTYAELGEVLAIREPSAHERVQRGLARLREKLGRGGLAAAAPGGAELRELLALAGTPATPLPGVEAKLLALARAEGTALGAPALPALGGLSGAWILGAGAVAVAVAAALAIGGLRSGAAERAQARASELALRASTGSSSQGPDAPARAVPESSLRSSIASVERVAEDQPAATLENGSLAGRVVDEFGLPLEGVELRASSTERHGKLAEFSGTATSARDGSFSLSLPVTLESGQDYALSARTPTLVVDAGVLRVRAARTTRVERIVLAREDVSRPGAWRLSLSLRDEEGRPVAGAIARVHWIVRNESGASWPQQQVAEQSGADGTLTLAGEGLGQKLLSVDAREAGLAPYQERIAIESAGPLERALVLRRGLELHGTIVDDEGRPLTQERLGAWSTPLYATSHDRNLWYAAELVEPGRFRIPALAPVPHTLHFQHARWSSFTLAQLEPGGEPLAIRLKRKSDASEIGTHSAEIHGSLIDAASGAPVPVRSLTTWLEHIADDHPALADADWTPLLVEAVIAQTASGFDSGADLPPPPPANAFVYDGLEPGRYAVRIHAAGFAPTLLGPLELAEREIASGFTVRLTRGAKVEGVLRDRGGEPLADACVLPLGDGELSRRHLATLDELLRSTAARGFLPTSAARTGPDGRFVLAHLPTDRPLRLYALHPEREPAHGPLLLLREGHALTTELRAGPRRER